jgi:outer membrane protein OmpA-like peptidoglycan-associated protein
MARLKELLFDSEVETLGELDQRLSAIEGVNETQAREQLELLGRVEQLFERSGTEERFRTSVANVLDQSFQEAELRKHDELSRAMAPLVVNTIKAELRNSQDELVQIMYPITGRMVRAFVVAEMKKLADSVNSGIDHHPTMLRLRSLISGKPVSDLAIADSQRLKVEEIFLIRRGSGELLGRWPANDQALSNADIHMSGLLSAINDIASSAFDDEGGHFKSFEYEGFNVHMRGSPMYLMAAKCTGVAPSGAAVVFDEAFLSAIERIGALEKAAAATDARDVDAAARSQELVPLAQTVEARTGDIHNQLARTRIGGAIVKLLLFLIAVPLLSWFFWGLYTSAEEASVKRTARSVITNTRELQGYQTNLDVGYRGQSLKVSGLVPNEATRSSLITALQRELPGTEIEAGLTALPKPRVVVPPPVQFDTAGIERRFKERIAAAERELVVASARRAMGRAELRLQGAQGLLGRLETSLAKGRSRGDLGPARDAVGKTIAQVKNLKARLQNNANGSDKLVAPINRVTVAVSGIQNKLVPTESSAPGRRASNATLWASTLVAAAEDLAAEAERLSTLVLSLKQAADIIPPPVTVSANDRLRSFADRNAIFFSDGTQLMSASLARKVLDEAAAAIKASTLTVRVVGYTDEKGDAAGNRPLAKKRADVIVQELVRRGVPADRLTALGRVDGYALSLAVGSASPNRRVEFEAGFRGEARTAQ